jgi:hypothetical protein
LNISTGIVSLNDKKGTFNRFACWSKPGRQVLRWFFCESRPESDPPGETAIFGTRHAWPHTCHETTTCAKGRPPSW